MTQEIIKLILINLFADVWKLILILKIDALNFSCKNCTKICNQQSLILKPKWFLWIKATCKSKKDNKKIKI